MIERLRIANSEFVDANRFSISAERQGHLEVAPIDVEGPRAWLAGAPAAPRKRERAASRQYFRGMARARGGAAAKEISQSAAEGLVQPPVPRSRCHRQCYCSE